MRGIERVKMERVAMAGERTNYLSVALRARAAIKTLKSLMNEPQGF